MGMTPLPYFRPISTSYQSTLPFLTLPHRERLRIILRYIGPQTWGMPLDPAKNVITHQIHCTLPSRYLKENTTASALELPASKQRGR